MQPIRSTYRDRENDRNNTGNPVDLARGRRAAGDWRAERNIAWLRFLIARLGRGERSVVVTRHGPTPALDGALSWESRDPDRVIRHYPVGYRVAYRQAAVLGTDVLAVGLALGPVMIAGSWVGKRIVDRLPERLFVAIIEITLVAAGALFLIRG